MNLITLILGLLTDDESEEQTPIELEDDLLKYYIIYEAVKYDIYLTYEDLEEILLLELDYMYLMGFLEIGEEKV
ncbi:MAG: hypothetical protein CFE24_14790 [Flavobacterium sp. BFFFF2]|nr:MAG: hypothetical protein CFE24_14790 [Flavobacterium sp. BFFFF2]